MIIDVRSFVSHLSSNPAEYRIPCNQAVSSRDAAPSVVEINCDSQDGEVSLLIQELDYSSAGLGKSYPIVSKRPVHLIS